MLDFIAKPCVILSSAEHDAHVHPTRARLQSECEASSQLFSRVRVRLHSSAVTVMKGRASRVLIGASAHGTYRDRWEVDADTIERAILFFSQTRMFKVGLFMWTQASDVPIGGPPSSVFLEVAR
eukprot:2439350-Pyramimonas_sp.AAC.1